MSDIDFPDRIESETQLDALLARPSDALVEFMANLDGDLIILGVAGKMGVSLAQLALAAIREAGSEKSVYGISRFSNYRARAYLESIGVMTIQADLLDRRAVADLPRIKNVVFMAGRKFGTVGAQSLTWAMNTMVPANVGEHFRESNIVGFSTGCVYPLVHANSAPDENVKPAPIGEYAQSCLGRERILEYFCDVYRTPVCLFRLNYAVDLRYGVLHDIAVKIWQDQPVNNQMGVFNVIWQGDANHRALMCLGHCTHPANIMNVTGTETLSTEMVAYRMGELMGKSVRFAATAPGELAYLNNSAKSHALFGPPRVTAEQLIRWQTHWLMIGGRSLDIPTHFEVTDGVY